MEKSPKLKNGPVSPQQAYGVQNIAKDKVVWIGKDLGGLTYTFLLGLLYEAKQNNFLNPNHDKCCHQDRGTGTQARPWAPHRDYSSLGSYEGGAY